MLVQIIKNTRTSYYCDCEQCEDDQLTWQEESITGYRPATVSSSDTFEVLGDEADYDGATLYAHVDFFEESAHCSCGFTDESPAVYNDEVISVSFTKSKKHCVVLKEQV